MILELELAPELESEVERQARQQGQSVSAFVAATLREKVAGSPNPRPRRVATGCGKYAGIGGTVDDFLAERHAESLAELERDEARARLYGGSHEGA